MLQGQRPCAMRLLGLGGGGHVGARADLGDVGEGRDHVGKDRRVVDVPHAVLLAHLHHLGLDVGVPGRREAGEEVVLNLEVEAARQVASDVGPIGRRGLHLRLVPVNLARLSGVPLRVHEVVREGEGDGEGERLHGRHDPHVQERRGPVVVDEGRGAEDGEVGRAEHPRDGAVSLPVRVVEPHSSVLGAGVVECEGVGVEDGAGPVEGEHGEHVEVLHAMHRLAHGAVLAVVVEEEEGVRAGGVRIPRHVVGEGVVGPVLLQPQVLAPPNHIRTETKHVVPEGVGRDGAVVGVVLHVEADGGLRHPDGHAQPEAAAVGDVVRGERGVGRHVEDAAEPEARRGEALVGLHDLSDLGLELLLELGPEGVVGLVVGEAAHALHLVDGARGVEGVDHAVLHCHVVAPKELDALATRVLEPIQIVHLAVDGDVTLGELVNRREDEEVLVHTAPRLPCVGRHPARSPVPNGWGDLTL
mmetsp:Transcript_22644/g.55890  ORF Transcript_22644/g.55890 Transcript_22644/m.55890 type:complete len:471 (+) Transcript_22644:445-1857(+)